MLQTEWRILYRSLFIHKPGILAFFDDNDCFHHYSINPRAKWVSRVGADSWTSLIAIMLTCQLLYSGFHLGMALLSTKKRFWFSQTYESLPWQNDSSWFVARWHIPNILRLGMCLRCSKSLYFAVDLLTARTQTRTVQFIFSLESFYILH